MLILNDCQTKHLFWWCICQILEHEAHDSRRQDLKILETPFCVFVALLKDRESERLPCILCWTFSGHIKPTASLWDLARPPNFQSSLFLDIYQGLHLPKKTGSCLNIWGIQLWCLLSIESALIKNIDLSLIWQLLSYLNAIFKMHSHKYSVTSPNSAFI